MAKVKSSDGKIIVVARYRPPGNVINHFQENVNPKVKTVCWSFCSDSFYWQRCIFFKTAPPYLRVWMTAPPLSEGLDPPLNYILSVIVSPS